MTTYRKPRRVRRMRRKGARYHVTGWNPEPRRRHCLGGPWVNDRCSWCGRGREAHG